MMEREVTVIRARLKAPRAGAIAGVVFSTLLIIILVLTRISVPSDPHDPGAWLPDNWENIDVALNLVPFAGIAFLWFIGVLRDRLGGHEDRFFATVFLGSGLLFLAMLFAASAVAGGIMLIYGVAPGKLMESGIYTFGRAVTYQIMHVYTFKMAGVFMITTSTLGIRTGIFPRWMALLGYALALLLLLGLAYLYWLPLVFPLWVLLISVYILVANLKYKPESDL